VKKFIMLILIAAGGWQFYNSQNDEVKQKVNGVAEQILNSSAMETLEKAKLLTQSSFRCDGRQLCSQMDSFEEAMFFLKNCPDTKMDGDHDGIPCERQFNQ